MFLLTYWIIFFNSALSPLKLINIKTSLEHICPKSPWEQAAASTKKEGIPIEANVEEIFFPIIPDLPTPEIIILPFLQFIIASTALLKELLILLFNFLRDFNSVSITCFAIGIKFFFFHF